MKHIISLGAGVQSSALALMAAKGLVTPMPECAVFADTQAETESVYTWLDWLETQLPFPVYRVTKGDLTNDALKIRTSKKGQTYVNFYIPTYQIAKDLSKGILHRKCTSDYKVLPIQKFVRAKFKKQNVIQWLGISTDEAHRMKDSRVSYITNRYPLVELNLSRSNCLQWMEANHYPMPPRSACVFCPYHSDKEWLRLKQDEPKEFQKAVEFERELQAAQANQELLKTIPFLHSSCKPLDTVKFRHQGQQNLFGNECEGRCGI